MLQENPRFYRQQQDDLPDHVKGEAYFEEHPRTLGVANDLTGYYIDTPKKTHCPVEFIRIQNEDLWVAIKKDSEGYWCTNEGGVLRNVIQLGWWTTDDPQHPHY